MRFEFFQEDVGRDFEDNVWNEEDNQSRVVFCASPELQIFFEAQNSGVADVDTAQEK